MCRNAFATWTCMIYIKSCGTTRGISMLTIERSDARANEAALYKLTGQSCFENERIYKKQIKVIRHSVSNIKDRTFLDCNQILEKKDFCDLSPFMAARYKIWPSVLFLILLSPLETASSASSASDVSLTLPYSRFLLPQNDSGPSLSATGHEAHIPFCSLAP